MNTTAVAKVLKVSPRTIYRWVKQLGLEMERNDLGHYVFTEEDIEQLKHVQDQINKGSILQDVTVNAKKGRKGVIKATVNDEMTEKYLAKLEILEKKINQKADDVVSYQLLQHRREIEDLQYEVSKLNERIEILETQQSATKKNIPTENLIVFDKEVPEKRMKKKNIITSLFGF